MTVSGVDHHVMNTDSRTEARHPGRIHEKKLPHSTVSRAPNVVQCPAAASIGAPQEIEIGAETCAGVAVARQPRSRVADPHPSSPVG